jgi:uncharacterized protein HemX
VAHEPLRRPANFSLGKPATLDYNAATIRKHLAASHLSVEVCPGEKPNPSLKERLLTMKKLLTLLFAFALTLSLSAVSFAQDQGATETKEAKKEAKKEKKAKKKAAKADEMKEMKDEKKDEMKTEMKDEKKEGQEEKKDETPQ